MKFLLKKLLIAQSFSCIFRLTTPTTLLRLFRQTSAPGGFSILGAL